MNRPDMEEDMYDAKWFRTKVREHDYYAQNLYAAICNNEFQKLDVVPILKEQKWSASWRAAGGVVARIQGHGDYLNWYCSGMGGILDYEDNHAETRDNGYVEEGLVTDEIREDLQKLGWTVITEIG